MARVGSPDYFDTRRAGQVDLTRTLRSPGSTLKPFIYGLGFEDGFVHPETLIDDRPTRYGSYAPQNFDFTFRGTVTVRSALQLSLNLAGTGGARSGWREPFDGASFSAGASLILPEGETPGLAIGLGGAGITLSDLVMLYSGIARLGSALPLIEQVAERPVPGGGDERRLMEPVAAWYVANILLGTPPPDNGVPGRIAFKTGTSYGYRDAWSVGFDGSHTIGIWVGRPDGAPVPGLVGRNAAAPILFDAFARLPSPPRALPRPPAGALMTTSAKLPPPLKHFAAVRITSAKVAVRACIFFFLPMAPASNLPKEAPDRRRSPLNCSAGRCRSPSSSTAIRLSHRRGKIFSSSRKGRASPA